MSGLQQAILGEEHGDIPAQVHTATEFDDLVKQLKTSAFHGVSSGFSDVHESFEKWIKDRTNKPYDFSESIFSGRVTVELLAEVKKALEIPLEWMSWFFEDPALNEGLIPRLKSEIFQPESNVPPKDVIDSSCGPKGARRWILTLPLKQVHLLRE